jgi:3',5'-cyclic AMP phosphodiesterase CpdA
MNARWRQLASVLLLSVALPLAAQTRFASEPAPVVVAQLSDLHIGIHENPLTHAPLDPLDHLRRAVNLLNQRHPDIVLVTGDIGDSADGWGDARVVLRGLEAPVYYAPGNHDVDSRGAAAYRKVFGRDYYSFHVRNVEFYVLDSSLLGNYDHIDAAEPEPLPPAVGLRSRKMLNWLLLRARSPRKNRVRIAVDHVPLSSSPLVPDDRPYWIAQEPYRSRAIDALHKLGVKDVLCGHWHRFALFEADGFTFHVAPALSFSAGHPVGFALHTITPDGSVRTEVVNLTE